VYSIGMIRPPAPLSWRPWTALLSALLLAGCAANRPKPQQGATANVRFMPPCRCNDANRPTPEQLATPLPDHADYQPIDEIETDTLLRAPGDRAALRFTRGPHQDETVEMTVSAEDEGWSRTLEGLRTTHFAQDDEGLRVRGEDDFEQKVRVTYQPPLLVLPPTLESASKAQAESRMTVTDLEGKNVRDKGHCRVEIELLGRQRVATPAGFFDAVIIRTTRTIDLGLADAEVVITAGYVPERGLVAEHIARTTRPLGLFTSKREDEMRLAEDQ